MDYLKLAWEYRYILLGAILGADYLRKNYKEAWAWFKGQLAERMLYIEKQAKDQVKLTGAQKMEAVVQYALTVLVPKAPLWMQLMLSEKQVRFIAQLVFDTALDLLDDGKLNKSHLL